MISNPETGHKVSNSTGVTASIPFRSESASVGDGAIHALLATSLLLAACLGVLLYAKKLGWLSRWIPASNALGQKNSLRMTGALRLSQKTSVYQVADGRNRIVVVESAGTTQVVLLPNGIADDRE